MWLNAIILLAIWKFECINSLNFSCNLLSLGIYVILNLNFLTIFVIWKDIYKSVLLYFQKRVCKIDCYYSELSASKGLHVILLLISRFIILNIYWLINPFSNDNSTEYLAWGQLFTAACKMPLNTKWYNYLSLAYS